MYNIKRLLTAVTSSQSFIQNNGRGLGPKISFEVYFYYFDCKIRIQKFCVFDKHVRTDIFYACPHLQTFSHVALILFRILRLPGLAAHSLFIDYQLTIAMM